MTEHDKTNTIIVPCAACGKLHRVDLARTDARPRCSACQTVLTTDAPVVLTDANFDTVAGGSSVPLLVDFYADWCGPCKMMAPVFADLARRQHGYALVAKVDTDRNPTLAMRYGIRSIPTVIAFRDGREVARQVGAVPLGALEQLLRTA